MGFWSSLLKYGGKAARGTGHVIGVTGKTLGSAALHPQRTLMGAGKAMQTAAVGSAAGYVTWEKLTTDKSVARIVGDAVIGENATEAVAHKLCLTEAARLRMGRTWKRQRLRTEG